MLMHDLMMQGYGHDESAPTPGGVFVDISWVGVAVLWNVRNGFWVLERVGQLYEVHLELA